MIGWRRWGYVSKLPTSPRREVPRLLEIRIVFCDTGLDQVLPLTEAQIDNVAARIGHIGLVGRIMGWAWI